MSHNNQPTPADLELVRQVQQQVWPRIAQKAHWTDEDFQDALYCHSEWVHSENTFCYSQASLELLAFDPRTPELQAAKLQAMLIQVTPLQINQLWTSR
jgi:hypothetical protein